MARGSAVEYASVAEACSKLFLAGETVSLPRVYDAIGNRGSSRVVQDYIKRWRKETADKLAITVTRNLVGLPDSLVARVDDVVVQLWQGALAQAEQTYLQARGELDLERAELTAERERDREDRERQAAALAVLEGDLKAARATLEAQELAAGELKTANQEADARLRERDAQVTALREEIARLSTTLESSQRQHAADLAAAQTRAEELVTEARRQAAQELEREREAAQGERTYLMQNTDEIRRAAKLNEQHLKDEAAGLRQMVDGYRQRANRAESDASRWQGRAEAAEELVAKFTTKRRKEPANHAHS